MSQPHPVRFLIGERLALRALESEDLPLLQRWVNHPRVRRWLLVIRPMDLEAERAWLESHDRSTLPRSLHMGITRLEDDALIGTTGMHRIDWVNRNAETGTMIGDSTCWGRGYATESKQMLLRYAFDTLGMHRMESHVIEGNTASARHLERCGYRVEGRFRQRIYREGRFHDTIHYGLLATEWRAAQADTED